MPEADGDTDRGRKPDARGGGQALDVFRGVALEDSPGSEKANTGNQALNHPGNVLEAHARLHRHQYEQRCPKRNQHMGAQAGGLASALAFIAEQAAENRRDQQTATDAGRVLQVGDVGELRRDGVGDARPPLHVLLQARLVLIWIREAAGGSLIGDLETQHADHLACFGNDTYSPAAR